VRTLRGDTALSRLTAVLAVAGVLLVAVAALLLSRGTPARVEGPTQALDPAGSPPVAASPSSRFFGPTLVPIGPRHRLPAGPPLHVAVPSLGLAAHVVPVPADGRTLDPPGDPGVLGWWAGGAWAGARRGSALVTGHTVHTGGGALDDLERVRPGARVQVRTTRGQIDYVVTDVVVLGKEEIARRAPELFSQKVAGRLVLVTCEDWDGEGYRSNVVVTARPRG
jgi:sortase family protein